MTSTSPGCGATRPAIHSANMNSMRYPSTPQMYPSSRDLPSQPSRSTLPVPSPILQGQTTTVWNRGTGPYRSLGARTPSPTPSEDAELSRVGAFNWQRLTQWRFWFRREWFCQLPVSQFWKHWHYPTRVLCRGRLDLCRHHARHPLPPGDSQIPETGGGLDAWVCIFVRWCFLLFHDSDGLLGSLRVLWSPSPYYSLYRFLRFVHNLRPLRHASDVACSYSVTKLSRSYVG